MLRLFVGIGFPPELKLRLSLLCSGVPGAKWVDPGNFHLTLRFIGETDETPARTACQSAVHGVSTKPGATAFTLISGPRTAAKSRVWWCSAALLAA